MKKKQVENWPDKPLSGPKKGKSVKSMKIKTWLAASRIVQECGSVKHNKFFFIETFFTYSVFNLEVLLITLVYQGKMSCQGVWSSCSDAELRKDATRENEFVSFTRVIRMGSVAGICSHKLNRI